MSRPLRIHVPGLLYHVFARGNEKQCIYTDDVDYQAFLDLLAATLPRFDVRCVAYCLIWNHYHAILKAGRWPISRLLQQVNSAYCQRFNRRHGRVGHVLQGRFGARLIQDGAYARTALRYLALNPVEAGRVGHPQDWPWSSYRFAIGHAPCPAFLALDEGWLAFGTSDPSTGQMRFAEFVAAGLQETLPNGLLHGSERLAGLVAPLLKPHQDTREYVYAHRYAGRPSVSVLFEGCVTQAARDGAAHTAFFDHAYTLEEIGAIVGRDPSVVCRWIQRAGQRTRASLPEDVRAKNKI